MGVAGKAKKLCVLLLVCECLVVLLSAVAERVELQQDETGYVPYPPIANKVFNISQIQAAYWYKELAARRFLISNYLGTIYLGNKLPSGKYELHENFSLVINNVTDSDGGAYVWQLKPKAGALKEGVVNVTIVGPGSSSPSEQSDGLPPGVIAAIVIAALVVIIMCAVLVYKKWVCKPQYERPPESDPESSPKDISEEFLDQLKTYYKDEMKTTPIYPMDFSKTRATEDIFVFPDMHVHHTDETQTKLNSLDDLMKLLHGNHHVAVVGSAGCGKTTLIGKIGHDWAYHGGSFTYVVILRMREIRGTSGFLGAVCKLLPTESEITKQQLKCLLKIHAKELLIILDGSCLSSKEFHWSTPKDDWSLEDVLSCRTLAECSLLVTISGHQLEQLQRYSSKYTVVKTDGFSSENIAEYIRELFGHGEEAKEFTETVGASEIISSLAKSPIMLQVLSLIWKDSNTLPQEIAALFDKAVDVLVQHISREDGSAWSHTDERRAKIGAVALSDLLKDQGKRSEFSRNDFTDGHALKFGLEIGVLLEESYTKGKKQKSIVKFSSIYYQEYLLACYLVHGSGGETRVKEKLLPKVTLETVQKNERLIRFCCGKSGNARSVIIDHLKGLRDSCDQPTQKQWLSNFIKDLCE